MDTHLERFSYGPNNRVVLVGDAAHPPVPHLGQGAQQGLEDAGILVEILKTICIDTNGHLDLTQFANAMKLYNNVWSHSAIQGILPSMGTTLLRKQAGHRIILIFVHMLLFLKNIMVFLLLYLVIFHYKDLLKDIMLHCFGIILFN